jgi:hypothetical protein
VRPTLSYDHPAWDEFVERHGQHMIGDDVDPDPEVIARRCNARGHRDDGEVVLHDRGEAFSATIAILDALELDIASSLDWLEDHGGCCDCTIGLNVIATAPEEEGS